MRQKIFLKNIIRKIIKNIFWLNISCLTFISKWWNFDLGIKYTYNHEKILICYLIQSIQTSSSEYFEKSSWEYQKIDFLYFQKICLLPELHMLDAFSKYWIWVVWEFKICLELRMHSYERCSNYIIESHNEWN